jgi:hypothetical protein
MGITKKVFSILTALFLIFSLSSAVYSYAMSSIELMDAARSSIITQGDKMPAFIKEARTDSDIRTLERIYESNTSLLTAVEAYFRMLKLVISSEQQIDQKVITSLNEWLTFISKQCEFNLEYMDSAKNETKDPIVIEQLNAASINIKDLMTAVEKAIEENKSLVE